MHGVQITFQQVAQCTRNDYTRNPQQPRLTAKKSDDLPPSFTLSSLPTPINDQPLSKAPYRRKTDPSSLDVNRWWSACFTDIYTAVAAAVTVLSPSDSMPCPLDAMQRHDKKRASHEHDLETFHFDIGMHKSCVTHQKKGRMLFWMSVFIPPGTYVYILSALDEVLI